MTESRLKEVSLVSALFLLAFVLGAFAMHFYQGANKAAAANTEQLNTLTRCWESVSRCEREREHQALQQLLRCRRE